MKADILILGPACAGNDDDDGGEVDMVLDALRTANTLRVYKHAYGNGQGIVVARDVGRASCMMDDAQGSIHRCPFWYHNYIDDLNLRPSLPTGVVAFSYRGGATLPERAEARVVVLVRHTDFGGENLVEVMAGLGLDPVKVRAAQAEAAEAEAKALEGKAQAKLDELRRELAQAREVAVRLRAAAQPMELKL